MKKATLLLLLFYFCNAKAQQVVYLINGSILHGKVLPNTDSTRIRIQIQGDDVLVYKKTEVERVEPEPRLKFDPKDPGHRYFNVS